MSWFRKGKRHNRSNKEGAKMTIPTRGALAQATPEAPDFKALVKAEVEAVFSPIRALFEKLQQAFAALVIRLETADDTATATRAVAAKRWTEERAELQAALREARAKLDRVIGITPEMRAAAPAPRADQTPVKKSQVEHERRIMAGSAPPPKTEIGG